MSLLFIKQMFNSKHSTTCIFHCCLYTFHAPGLFLYPLKTKNSQRFSDIFFGGTERDQSYELGSWVNKSGSIQQHSQITICDALRDLVPSVQFKKREKHPWSSICQAF